MKNYYFTTSTLALLASVYSVNCEAQTKGNVLVIVADDLGKDVLSMYNTPTLERAVTPNLDKLAKQGVVFDNFYAAPLSAPARAAMLTGRHGYHTGIVALEIDLPLSETTIFEALPEDYSNAVIGKWHLSKDLDFAPKYGIDHFAGFARGGGLRDYSNWQFTENGKTESTTDYSTTKITNSAKEWIAQQQSPWFCLVAYNAPHTPLHLPASYMHTRTGLSGTAEDIQQNPLPYFLAMVESLDYELGRLLEDVDESTTVIFIGDNGTGKNVLQKPYPSGQGKSSLYQSGVCVPMIVAGNKVSEHGSRSDQAVSIVDMFPTVMELAGQSMPQYEDSYSFIETFRGGATNRKYNFSDIYNRRSGYMCALSDGKYKAIFIDLKPSMLFDLDKDPLEENNLMSATLSNKDKKALSDLQKQLKDMDVVAVTAPASSQNGGNRGAMRNNNANNRGNANNRNSGNNRPR